MSHLPFEEWSDQITRSVQALNEDVHALKVNSARDKQVDALIQLQEKQMNHLASYTNLIMVAGYAGYFAFWSTMVTKLPQWIFALCGLLMTISLTLFIAWEIIKAFGLAGTCIRCKKFWVTHEVAKHYRSYKS